jgi:hypothetical protein
MESRSRNDTVENKRDHERKHVPGQPQTYKIEQTNEN